MFKGYKIIALCITKISNEGYLKFIENLNRHVCNHGYRLFVYHSCSDLYWNTSIEDGDRAIFEAIPFDVIDALIIWENSFYNKGLVAEIINNAERKSIPIIMYGAVSPGIHSILYDDENSFRKVVEHVIVHHKATDVCFIAGSKGEHTSEQRINIFSEVLEANGLEFDEGCVYYGNYWSQPTEIATEEILRRPTRPQAIICANDVMALTACAILEKHNISVPDDVIVTGFDGVTIAYNSKPAITTAAEDVDDMAEKIIEISEKLMCGESVPYVSYANVKLTIMESCGCTPNVKIKNPGRTLLTYQDGFNKYQGDERNFYRMSEKIFSCVTIEDFAAFLNSCPIQDSMLLFNLHCFDETVNPTVFRRKQVFDRTLLYSASTTRESKDFPMPFDLADVVPDAEFVLQQKNPIVFSSLSFLGQPAGILINYGPADMFNYQKIQQCVTYINDAIGNYMLLNNLRYTTKNLKRISEQDYLTGVYNRTGFFRNMSSMLAEKTSPDKYVTIVSLDLNDLKYINDNYGHEEGDFAIRSLAKVMGEIPFSDMLCCRYGGDEMVICIVSDSNCPDTIIRETINEGLAQINKVSGKPFKVSASVGISTQNSVSFDFEEALEISDAKMYAEKYKTKKNSSK